MEGLSSLTCSVLTVVKSRIILVVHVSVLGVGWAILQHVDLIYRLHIICYNKTCLAVFARLYFTGVAQ